MIRLFSKQERGSGFAVVELLIIVLVLGLVGAAGVYFVHQKDAPPPQAAAKSVPPSRNTLEISEWKVRMDVAPATLAATYHMVDGTAWLSSEAVDKSQDCRFGGDYYGQRTFQGMKRYSPEEMVDVVNPSGPGYGYDSVKAQDAPARQPDQFIHVNGYVYEYFKGNGGMCNDDDHEAIQALSTAFKTLTPY